ncbi:MAG: 50S ribosomal protein L11 methyltransferase [Flavobacterium sp.]|nr:50S ribosomal protein L11 methyltransferase [Flavobacterium sp.]
MSDKALFFQSVQADVVDVLIAELLEIGFNGFEEVEEGLKAFINEADFDEAKVTVLAQKYSVNFTTETIPVQNWNEVWESNFNPMQVANFVGVRANFHAPMQGVTHEIVITPKMSFGTGHHATTYMVMQLMKDINFANKTVFDYGTGTGILAILAEKLGSKSILAIDYDDWCIENATENLAANGCQYITIEKADTAKLDAKFNIVIANINKNIILDNMAYLANEVVLGGEILLSGLLQEDEAEIIKESLKFNWKHQLTIKKGMWIALHFVA